MNDKGIIASYLLSPLSKITNPENTSQFTLMKDSNSNRVNDLLIHNTTPNTFYNSLLTFFDTRKELKLKGDLSKMITNKNYFVDLGSLSDEKLLFDFAQEMHFDEQTSGNNSTRDRTYSNQQI